MGRITRIALTLLLINCTSLPQQYKNITPSPHNSCAANQDTLENLLNNIMESGYLKPEMEKEIIQNDYGIFGIDTCGKNARACYVRKKGEKDTIYLKKKLFCGNRFDSNGKVVYKSIDWRIERTLIHELFHDFWYNQLTLEERLEFSIEAEIWFSKLDKKSELYKRLNKKRNDYDDKFFGAELFSIIAGDNYTGELAIPKYMKKFYGRIVSDL